MSADASEPVAGSWAWPRADRLAQCVFIVCALTAAWHVYANLTLPVSPYDHNVIHFAAFALLAALLFPLRRASAGAAPNRWRVWDLAFGIFIAAGAGYLAVRESELNNPGSVVTVVAWVAIAATAIGALYLTWRTVGLVIPLLVVIAISYLVWWGPLVPGVFRFAGLSLETVALRSIYGEEAMFGLIARISSTFVMMFMIFGAFLIRSGAGEFVIGVSQLLAGRLVGGPGFVAVLASGLTGTISGSAVANTAQTGVVTIPMMRRAGFPATRAAGIEAAASTGGQLMPPIMGAGALVMANITQIPYATIVAVSVLPALLYFAGVAFYVRITAKAMTGSTAAPSASSVVPAALLRHGGLTFFLPITVLVVLLVTGYTPTYAAAIATGVVVVASWLTPRRMGPIAIAEALALGARNMVATAVLLCTVGLFVNVVVTAGIGNIMSLMIHEWAHGHLLAAIALIAVASLIMGMGLPVTAAYIVLATLSAPALTALIVDRMVIDALVAGATTPAVAAAVALVDPALTDLLGAPMSAASAQDFMHALPGDIHRLLRTELVDRGTVTMALLAAHLVIFWLSQDSNVTPPVCLTAFTAAAIAGTRPMQTGLQSWVIAKALYVVPLLIVYTPLVTGNIAEAIPVFLFGLVGLYAMTGLFQGRLEAPTTVAERGILAVAAILLLWPLAWVWHLAGVTLFAFILWSSTSRAREGKA